VGGPPTFELTRVLADVGQGDPAAKQRLFDLVYRELHSMASGQMRGERQDHTLQTTALVHEAYLRLFGDGGEVKWESRAHFFSAAAEVMRRILVDHARTRAAQKRGGDRKRLALDDPGQSGESDPQTVLDVDAALRGLEAEDPVPARVVVLRFFGGLSMDEVADSLAISTRTAKRHWRYARAWMYRYLSREGSPETAPTPKGPGDSPKH